MKKVFVFAVLSLCLITAIALLGCGSSTSTDTTTTIATTTTLGPASASATAVGTGASVGTTALLGIANVGSAVGNAGSITGAPSATSALRATGLMAFTIPVAPPDSFFEKKDSSWDGYLTVPSIHTGETVSIRFTTTGGSVINGAIFTTPTVKQIASLEGINWDNLVSPETITDAMWQNGILHWLNPAFTTTYMKYQGLDTLWDYLLWSTILPKVQTYAQAKSPTTLPPLSTPTATIEIDMMGGFSGTVTRDVSATNYGVNLSFLGTMEYATYITPAHEVPKTLSGGGTVSLPDGKVVNLTMNLGFITTEAGGIIPTSGTLDWNMLISGETWSGTATLNGSSRTASGDVKKAGTTVGTLYLDGSGGAVVTIEGVTYNVTTPR